MARAKLWAALKADPVAMEAHRVKMRQYRKTFHQTHPNTHGDRTKYGHDRKTKNRMLIEQACQSGCKLCPETDQDCLDFHHTDPTTKDGTISKMLGVSTPVLAAEIAKCVVLCANCHRKVHARLKRGESPGL